MSQGTEGPDDIYDDEFMPSRLQSSFGRERNTSGKLHVCSVVGWSSVEVLTSQLTTNRVHRYFFQ